MREEVPCGIEDCPFVCASAPARLVHIKAMHTRFDGTVIGLKNSRIITLPRGGLQLIENTTSSTPEKDNLKESDFVLLRKEKESAMIPRVSIYKAGFIRINARAIEALGTPTHVTLSYTKKGYLGIRAAPKDLPDAYKLTCQKASRGVSGYLISAKPVVRAYGLVPKAYEAKMIGETLAFKPEKA